ncbi:hypothetical protein [Bizionia paragorgiae]|uniref:hypothetical protein n=1 Tax=Bizionia paragorgiae TaxID=283786 RepID=UPI003A9090BA
MYSVLNEEEKLKHPNYQIIEFGREKLKLELESWSREDLIEWLVWNDGNGVYRDEDSLREFDNILGKKEAIEIVINQVFL